MEKFLNASIGNFSMGDLISAAILFLICLAIIKILMRILVRMIEKSSMDRSLQGFIRSFIKVLLYILAGLIVADSLNIPVTSLVAAFSVVGLAVSLAVQDSLANLASGISILVTKPFAVGDYIDADTVSGTVGVIGLSYTKLLTADNKSIFVPNSQIGKAKIVNYTDADIRRVEVNVTASYDCPPDRVKAALADAVSSTPGFLDTPAPFINIFSYRESAVEYTVRAWVNTPDYWTAYYALLENIGSSFAKFGVEMTYNHLNVHILGQN